MKHEFVGTMHCGDCFQTACEGIIENDSYQQDKILVSFEQYQFCVKYGVAEGLIKWRESNPK